MGAYRWSQGGVAWDDSLDLASSDMSIPANQQMMDQYKEAHGGRSTPQRTHQEVHPTNPNYIWDDNLGDWIVRPSSTPPPQPTLAQVSQGISTSVNPPAPVGQTADQQQAISDALNRSVSLARIVNQIHQRRVARPTTTPSSNVSDAPRPPTIEQVAPQPTPPPLPVMEPPPVQQAQLPATLSAITDGILGDPYASDRARGVAGLMNISQESTEQTPYGQDGLDIPAPPVQTTPEALASPMSATANANLPATLADPFVADRARGVAGLMNAAQGNIITAPSPAVAQPVTTPSSGPSDAPRPPTTVEYKPDTIATPTTTPSSGPPDAPPIATTVTNTGTDNPRMLSLVGPQGQLQSVEYGPELDRLIQAGYRPLDSSGQPYDIEPFNGGWLVGTDQGWVPFNVLMGENWGEGQQALINNAIKAGGLPALDSPSEPANVPYSELGFGSLAQPFDQPFTGESVYESRPFGEQFDFSYDNFVESPAFRRRMEEGQRIIERSSAGRGNLFSGRTGKELTRFGQDLASEEFDKQYNRSLGEFSNREGIFRRNEAARASDYDRSKGEYLTMHDIFKGNQADIFNRFASLAGLGQTAASRVGDAGQRYAQDYSNTMAGSTASINDLMTSGAAATAGGRIGGANARIGGVAGLGQGVSDLILLRQLGLL